MTAPKDREVATVASLSRDQKLRQQLLTRRAGVARAAQEFRETLPEFEAAGRRYYMAARYVRR